LKNLHIVFCLLMAGFAFGQKPYVELIIDPETVEVGQNINVTVKANVHGDINIDLPKHFVQGNNVINGMEQEYDAKSGEMITFIYYSKNGTMTKPGTYTFGPAYVRKGKTVYRSNTISVQVKDYAAHAHSECETHQLKKSAFGLIELAKEEVYAGEPVVVKSKVVSKFRPSKYDSYTSSEVRPALKKYEIKNKNHASLRIEKIAGSERYVFDLDKHVIFPTRPGKVVLKPFELTLQAGFDSYPVKSERNFVQVKALPKDAPDCFQGAVGKFEISQAVISTPKNEGDVLSLCLTLKGRGNIHDLSVPKLELPLYLKQYGDPEIVENFNFSEAGSAGTIKVTYHLQVLEGGSIRMPDQFYAYFSPQTERYEVLKLNGMDFNVEVSTKSMVAEQKNPVPNSEIDEYLYVEEPSEAWYDTTAFKWIGGGLPVMAILFLLFIKQKKKQDEVETQITPSHESLRFDSEKALREMMAFRAVADGNAFFNAWNKSLHKAMAMELGFPDQVVLSEEQMDVFFKTKKNTPELEKEIREVLMYCQSVRYGMQSPNEDLSAYIKQARKLFEDIAV
jgi:hypothetical protein